MTVDYRYMALFAFWLVIAVRCHQHGLTRRYWPYMAFVAVAALTLAVRLLAESAWGTGSQEFLTAYFVTEIAYNAAAVGWLLWLHYLPFHPDFRRDWPILLFAAGAFALEMWATPGAHYVLRFVRAMSIFRALLAFKTVLRCFDDRSGLRMGTNLAAPLIAQFFLAACSALAEIIYLASWLPHRSLEDALAFLHVAGWGVAAWGILGLDTPERRK